MRLVIASVLGIASVSHAHGAVGPLSDFCTPEPLEVYQQIADCQARVSCDAVDEYPSVFERYADQEQRAQNYILSKLASSKHCMKYASLLFGSGLHACKVGQVPFVHAIFDLISANKITSSNSNDLPNSFLGLASNGNCV